MRPKVEKITYITEETVQDLSTWVRPPFSDLDQTLFIQHLSNVIQSVLQATGKTKDVENGFKDKCINKR